MGPRLASFTLAACVTIYIPVGIGRGLFTIKDVPVCQSKSCAVMQWLHNVYVSPTHLCSLFPKQLIWMPTPFPFCMAHRLHRVWRQYSSSLCTFFYTGQIKELTKAPLMLNLDHTSRSSLRNLTVIHFHGWLGLHTEDQKMYSFSSIVHRPRLWEPWMWWLTGFGRTGKLCRNYWWRLS